ncbi:MULTISPECIES: GNAT family N-acetyltransferase [Bradyrhizobium]|jgi:GNAT superfamily N-acetyltransferase|uniref:GNAT family N-acetyltransferase n=1 Tax=Bradyrhizobium TaxID=374 RepID=UPI0004854C69|nr:MULTISPECIES: GNAT family N-acetyltransferase [Bradyrhizobium]MDI2057261.1 GNAT family N-acetyltransferase [Bradyrhizobium sp. Mp19]MDI2103991.1 GNAT family N-acetyltransferase [Bradyrhizobium sp. Mp64]WLA96482.1 GNAT family N-acetyltransferase [Bradyrhizobium elkanii]WLC12026.1 GNAT family N-acetyltransferase [Bradyrhizobium elkanii USDA 94]
MTSSGLSIRRLTLADMDAAARVHRTAFDQALPWLAGLHTPDEDRWFYREQMFATCTLWGAFDGAAMRGVIAFHDDWIEQLYVLPDAQGRGIGGALLEIARQDADRLQLWTFQRNARARRFYETRGFVAVEETDGSGNGEREPGVRYRWTRAPAGE